MNKNSIITYLSIVLLVLSTGQPLAVGATTRHEFGRLTLENGLAGESVNKVIRDCGGLTWIATSNGVSLFNGAQAITVGMASTTKNHKPSQNIFDICETKADHSIYISTPEGIFRLAMGDNQFRLVLPDMGKCHLTSKGDKLYVSNSKGLHVYDGRRLTSIDMGGENNVRAMTLDADGTLYVLTTNALCRYVDADNRLMHKKIIDNFPAGISFSAIAIIGNTFYIGSKNHGLYSYTKTGQATRIDGIGNVVNSVVADGSGNLCVSTDGTGAYLVDGSKGVVVESFKSSTYDTDTDALYYYLRTPDGCDWFCQSHFGLVYSYRCNGLFQTYASGGFTTEDMPIRSFLLDGQRKLIGTLSGLHVVDEQTGKVKHISAGELGGGNIVTGIERMGNHYYIGTYDGGLHRLDVATLSIGEVEAFANLKGEGTIINMKKSTDGKLWIGTNTGIVIIDENERATYVNSRNSGIKEGAVNSITFAPNGHKWLGGSKGLSVMTADGSFVNDKSFPKGFFNNERYLMGCCSETGQLYMGNRQGIFRTNADMGNFGKIAIPDRIIDENCNAIYCDNDSGLWITSEKGLFRICLNGERLIHFGHGMGIECHHFLRSGIIARGDTLWVASPDGLKYMSLKQMWEYVKRRDNRIMLYDVFINGQRLPIANVRNANISRSIRMTWNFISQTLTAKVVLNDYAKPDGRLFEYKMDNQQQWHLFNNGEELTMSNMSLGSHQLTIRVAGISGSETTYKVSTVPSSAFIIEALLTLAAIILLLAWRGYHRRTKTLLNERNDMADALVEMETEVETMLDEQENQLPAEDPTKYEKLRIPADECQQIVERMNTFLEKHHAYRNPDLKRSDIAKEIHMPVAKLSYIFSQHLKVNYYDYINHYRLEEFKRLIAEGEYQRYTVQALSERCGFKKSSFFSTFRKVEGMTPTEYLRRQKVKIDI